MSCNCDPAFQYTYHPPEYINDGFEVGSLEEVNIDSALLKKAVDKINCGKYDEVHSMIIFKDNKLVFEEYFQGHKYKWDRPNHHGDWISWDKSTLHGAKSVSKSITSICIGIAIDKGFIESVHQSIFDYLPDHQHLKMSGKERISIEHLLTMTSGLEWDEWGASLSSASNDMVGIWYQDKDPITFILERPLINVPGTTFTYSGGNTAILGEIIRNASNMELLPIPLGEKIEVIPFILKSNRSGLFSLLIPLKPSMDTDFIYCLYIRNVLIYKIQYFFFNILSKIIRCV